MVPFGTWSTWFPEVWGKDLVPLFELFLLTGLLDLSLNCRSFYTKDKSWKYLFTPLKFINHYLWTQSAPLIPGRQLSLLLPNNLSQVLLSLAGRLLGLSRGELGRRQILINNSKPVHEMSEVCRIKLTSEEEEKLLLVDRLVEVGHVVAKSPSLPPGPSFLVESPVLANFSHGHPRLKLSLSSNCIAHSGCITKILHW